MSFDKNRWISGRLAKILMAALMIALIVVPASAISCSTQCTAWKKVPGANPTEETRSPIVYTFVMDDDNTYGLQLFQSRYCAKAVYERTCYQRQYCPTTKKCEKILPGTTTQRPASGLTCSPWVTTFADIVCLGPNCI